MTALWDAGTADAIGATWLLAAIAPVGAFGRRARAAERPLRPGDESVARAAIERVAAIAASTSDTEIGAIREAIAHAPDLRPLFARAGAHATLDDVDLFELGRLLDAFAQLAVYADSFGSEAIADLRAALAPGRTAARGFYLGDDFDETLARERGRAAAAQTAFDAARSRLTERVATFAGIEHVRDGEFVLMRDAIARPLPPEIRVVREAPTFLLCEIALDDVALDALADRDAAVACVAAAEDAVRARLTAGVARAVPALARACDALGELDLLVARARFARTYACVVPEIATDGGYALAMARDEPLREALARHGRTYAPISFDLAAIGVVTGPNMGGKTAALRTLGFVAACVALGVPVPAACARVVLVDEIAWLGIGAGCAADDGLLSSFGREVVSLRAFLARPPRRALALVDEFARTTSPREGRALLVALLERLRDRGALGLAATHLADIARDAGVAHYAVGGVRADARGFADDLEAPLDLDAALARIARAMDYRIARVDEDAVPAADALELARALGLDAPLVARARAALERARTPRA